MNIFMYNEDTAPYFSLIFLLSLAILEPEEILASGHLKLKGFRATRILDIGMSGNHGCSAQLVVEEAQ